MKSLGLILLLAVMASCSSITRSQNLSREIASERIYVVKKFIEMYSIGRLYSTHKIANLTTAMIHKNKTPKEVNLVYKRVKRIFPINSDQAQLSEITKFFILNDINLNDQEKFNEFEQNYKKIKKGLPVFAFDSALQLALLTTAIYVPKDHASPSHYSVEEVITRFKSIKRKFGGIGSIEQFAELTKLSFEKNLDPHQVYQYFLAVDNEKSFWYSNHQVAILTSAMIHSGFSAVEVVNAHDKISSNLIEMASEYTAELTRTALILEAKGMTENLIE